MHTSKVWTVWLGALFVSLVAAVAENREEWQQPDRVLTDLGLRAGMTVADMGCGNGYFTLRLARAVGERGRVHAADIDKEALADLRKKFTAAKLANIDIVQSEPTRTKLTSDTLDAALICNVIHEADPADRQALVQDVARALKTGGHLYLIDWKKSHDVKFDPYEKLIPRDDLLKLVTDAGLTFDAEFYYLKYQVFFRFRKP